MPPHRSEDGQPASRKDKQTTQTITIGAVFALLAMRGAVKGIVKDGRIWQTEDNKII